jgi:hypothetical protein
MKIHFTDFLFSPPPIISVEKDQEQEEEDKKTQASMRALPRGHRKNNKILQRKREREMVESISWLCVDSSHYLFEMAFSREIKGKERERESAELGRACSSSSATAHRVSR